MKAILKFNLPEEECEFKQMLRARDMDLILYEMASWLRNKLKHDEMSEEARKAFNEVRDEFWELCGERNYDPCGE